ncbi:DBH-like monooxygenase protein 2 homolog [Biomphalaria glabrata]|uniref:DBH-like monooxygenase protein 2 homolog n=1 Tax=Biomphalaria glabrata TaxID=6526 RepID=A0A9W2YEH2_BIOGL|nr:DBH-like monooxygenase protein 2 homolog [Biomphalaria glabrata]
MQGRQNTLRVVTLLCVLGAASSYKMYQLNIPNGNIIPHPCKENTHWAGVGHFLDTGAGYTNPFGEDFSKEGHAWTTNLCMKDSDGDGRTNGQELGDPDCLWKKNSTASRATGLSHPGVCEPLNSTKCLGRNVTHPKYRTQDQWLMDVCKTETFPCPALTETDVKEITLRLPSGSKVPAKETTYICQMFNLENMTSPGDYHMVAVEPILDNTNVIHHMVLFGCSDNAPVVPDQFECGMVASDQCQKSLSIWTVGLKGDCYHPNIGIRLGTAGYKKLAIQLHWNNPDKRSTWTDSSGMKLYYTANRRLYDAGMFTTGLQHFVLPPRKQTIVLKSTCSSTCTKSFMKGPIYVTMAWNHMHYAGVRMSIEVIRDHARLLHLTNEETYNYDSPQVSFFNEKPVELLPGDEFTTRCEFNTSKRDKSTLFGEATNEEMCFGFLTYYPLENLSEDSCLGSGPDVMYCDPNTYRGCADLFNNYTNFNTTKLYTDLTQNCIPVGPCLEECKEAILLHKKENPCLRDEIFEFIKQQMWRYDPVGSLLINLFASCEIEVYKSLNQIKSPQAKGRNSAPKFINDVNTVIPILLFFFSFQ